MNDDLTNRLRVTKLDKDNCPRMGSERVGSVDLCLEAADALEKLQAVIDEQAKMLKDRDELQAEVLEQKAEIERHRKLLEWLQISKKTTDKWGIK